MNPAARIKARPTGIATKTIAQARSTPLVRGRRRSRLVRTSMETAR
jgi:hypothetical protein